MSFLNKKRFDDDDDDLESLRLAALKSLATKKEAPPPLNGGNAIEVLENGPILRISTVRPINTLDNANLNVRLDITEPYIPQSVSNVGRMDWNYNAAYMGNIHAKPSIIPTLSPRSLAFVEQNNDILMRRKGEKSTRSPSPYRENFMRWSESPPPVHKRRSPSFRKSHSRSISRSPLLNNRFSKSPPPPTKSPRRNVKSPGRNTRPFKKRSKSRSGRGSRSPIRRGDSPVRIHPERRRSTSLYSSNHQNKFSSRSTTTKQNDRLTPPPMRHRRSSRSQSPVHVRNKSHTPPSQPARTNRKRSRSPYQPPHHMKRSRSISRSPHRKARPRSREYGSGGGGGGGGYSKGGNNKHYANKNIEFNRKYLSQNNYSNRNTNKYHNSNNSKYSNKYDNRRELPRSPAKYRSKSKSPVAHHHPENGPKADNKKLIINNSTNNKIESSTNSKDIVPHNELEHDKLSSTDDDDQNSTENDDNNDEDGIDLFASEESESENEGRFKSSSKNTDNKKVATLSYSKLSETAAVCVSELKDMNANSSWNDRDYSRRNNGDRNRDRDRKNSRRGTDRDDNWKITRRNRTKEDESDRNNKKTEKSNSSNSGSTTSLKMFRSTFQAVDDSDLNSKNENPSISNEDKSINKNSIEGNSEMRSVLHLKRSLLSGKEVSKHGGASTEDSTKTYETSVTNESTGCKKPIHLRLGAISNSSSKVATGGGSGGSSGSHSQSGKPNTSWKSKKSWRTEKVSINIYL